MTGIVDVGGGLRDIYGVGVLDYCMDRGIVFDDLVGVSAGSANLASYMGGQKGRNYRYYTEYAFRDDYMSLRNFLHSGSYVDLDYVYGTLSNQNGEDPLDYGRMAAYPGNLTVVACNAETGEATYFGKQDLAQDHYEIFMASSCVPVACRPYVIKGVPYYDGGIADPIPVQRAMDDGCDKVVVILTRPKDVLREPGNDKKFAELLWYRHPRAAALLRERYRRYNDGVALAKRYERAGKALVLAPDDIGGMHTLTKDRSQLELLYQKGLHDAKAIEAFLRN